MNKQEFQRALLKAAKEAGFTEAEMYYEKSTSFNCTIFEGEIDSCETSEEGGVSFRGLYNGRMGYAYTEKIDHDSISFLTDQAKENASILDEDDGTTIFEGSDAYNTHSYYNEKLEEVSTEEKIALIQSIEKKVLAFDPKIVRLNYCVLQDFSSEKILANNKGLAIDEKQNGLVIFVSAVAQDGEEMKTGSAVKLTRDFSAIDADAFAKKVAEEALAQLGEQSIPAKKYPVIMRHDASASLLATLTPIFSAENTQKGQSLLKDKVGETIASPAYTLIDDPYHPDSLQGTNFDGEGVATKKQMIVEAGTLKTLFHNRKTAKKDGVKTTGNARKSSYKGTLSVGPINLYIQPGSKSKEDLISSVQEGVFITRLAGLHSGVNSISGDFSVAATGFYIKDGKISSPVKQMTVAGNYFDYLKQIKEIGSDLEFSSSGYGSPSLLVKELSVTVDD